MDKECREGFKPRDRGWRGGGILGKSEAVLAMGGEARKNNLEWVKGGTRRAVIIEETTKRRGKILLMKEK